MCDIQFENTPGHQRAKFNLNILDSVNSVNIVNSVNSVNSVNNVNSVNSVNIVGSYSAVLPPSPMVFLMLIALQILQCRLNLKLKQLTLMFCM